MPEDAENALASLRDELRSARRWQELLTEADRRRLLSDIARVALAIGRDLWPGRNLSDLDIGDNKGATDAGDACPRERLAFLEAAWPRLSAALRLIENAPPVAVTPVTSVVPAERARRVSPRAVLEAVRAGDFAAAPAHLPLAARLGGHLPRRVTETAFETTHDTPANRGVKTLLAQWARDLTAVANLADSAGDARVAAGARNLRRALRAHLTADDGPWRDLTPLPAVPPLPAPLQSHGAYRSLYELWRRYREGFTFDWANPLFALSARETWHLYEYGCLFAVADALRGLGWRATRADGFALTRGGLTFTLAPGASVRWTHAGGASPVVTLTYRRHFRTAAEEEQAVSGGKWHSRSHALMPDITLECEGRLLIFDAKFKTYAGTEWQTGDIRQMHSYRDAIRRGGEAGAVAGAWLLYAGRAAAPNRPVIAYPASTGERPFGNGDVGALLLRPGMNQQERAFLAELLRRFTHPT